MINKEVIVELLNSENEEDWAITFNIYYQTEPFIYDGLYWSLIPWEFYNFLRSIFGWHTDKYFVRATTLSHMLNLEYGKDYNPRSTPIQR